MTRSASRPAAAARHRIRLGSVIRGAAALAFGALVLGFVFFAAGLQRTETPPARHADGIVVLTGGADRVADAIELLAKGHADRLLITGVNPATSRESLERRLPRISGVIACCVDLGYQALNTAGNARETAGWVRANGLRSLIVVTSNYHMPRAMAEIADLLPGIDLQAHPVVAERSKAVGWWPAARRARLMAWEYLKYVAVLARTTVVPGSSRGELTASATPTG